MTSIKENVRSRSAAPSARSLLLATAMAISVGMPALAQEYEGVEPEALVADAVIVTATRRAERLIDVPLSIQAIGGDELEKLGAVDFSDYVRTVAGISFIDSGAGRSQISIRGVTTGQDIGQGAEATVGVYLDETPISEASSQPDIKLFDIDRVEVLRGPQGTLYGSGSLGGTIRVLPNMPDFDGVSGQLKLTGSSTESGGFNKAVNGWVNLPLSDKAAVRIVGYGIRNDGFLDDNYGGNGSHTGKNINDEKTYGGRLTLRVQPTEKLDVVLTGIYQKGEFGAFEEVTDNFPGLVIQQSADQPFEDEYKIANLKVVYDFDFATLTSATSYFDRSRYLENDIDYFLEALAGIPRGISPLLYEANTFSQEVRLTSNGDGPFSWLVGAFYLDRSDDFNQTINVLGAPAPATKADNLFYLDRASDVEQVAGFAEVSYDLTDRLTATAGVRISDIKRKNVAETDGLLLQEFLSGDFSEQSTTPKFNLSYHLTDDSLIYFQAAKGFRIGGVNPGLPPCDPAAGCAIDVGSTYDSDSLWNYEIGSKLQLFDNAMTLTASVFYIDWSDIQLSVSRGDGFDGFLNAGDATSQGAEVETSFQVNKFLSIGGQVTYTDATLESLPVSVADFAIEGQKLPGVAKWSSAANFELGAPIWGNEYAYLRGDLQYVGSRENALGPFAEKLDNYSLLSLRAGIQRGPYDLSLFANNLTDERAELFRQSVFGVRNGDPLQLDRTSVNRPRTIGVSVSRQF